MALIVKFNRNVHKGLRKVRKSSIAFHCVISCLLRAALWWKFNRNVRKGLRKERKVQEYGFMVKILTEQTLTIKLFRLKEKPFQRQVLWKGF